MSNGPTITLPPNLLPSFFEDLRLLANPASDNLVRKALQTLGAYLGTSSDAGQWRLEDELASGVSSDQMTARRVLQMLAVLSNNLAAEAANTEPAQAAAKLVEILQRTAGDEKDLHLSTEELSRLEKLFAMVAEGRETLKQDADAQNIIRGVLPMFEDLRATVELRSLHWPLAPDNTETERAFKFVPIASLRLQLDSGEPPMICFQATASDVASMLEKLQRLQAAIRKLEQTADALSPKTDAKSVA